MGSRQFLKRQVSVLPSPDRAKLLSHYGSNCCNPTVLVAAASSFPRRMEDLTNPRVVTDSLSTFQESVYLLSLNVTWPKTSREVNALGPKAPQYN